MQDINVSPVSPDPPIMPGSLSRTEALRLKKTAQEFESLLVAYMLKAMRETINRPEDERGLGREYYESLFDSEVATSLSRTQGFGLAETLYRQLTGESMQEAHEDEEPVPLTPVPRSLPKTSQAVPSSSVPAVPAYDHSNDGVSATAPPLPDSAIARIDRYTPLIYAAAQRYSLDPDLLRSIILAESNGWARAVSPKGARGLMQLMPATADTLDVKDPMDPHQNIFGGARYLRSLLDAFADDLHLALASYNAGPGAVREHGGVPPYEETRGFIDRVLDFLGRFKQSHGVPQTY